MMGNHPIGTKIMFPDTVDNRYTLIGEEDDGEGFFLNKVYEVAGYNDAGQFFYDDHGCENYAGCDADGSSGVYVVVEDAPQ